MTQRVLVLYGTTDGQTAKIADAIGGALRHAGVHAEVLNAARHQNVRPDDFDAVIVAASIHAGGYQRAVVRWVRAHAADLNRRPTAFVSVCLGVLQHDPAVDRDLDAIAERFFAKTDWHPTETKVVAGALRYTEYGWWKRRIMRNIAAKAHGDTDTSRDFEYTDWTDLAAFTQQFVARVTSQQPVRLVS